MRSVVSALLENAIQEIQTGNLGQARLRLAEARDEIDAHAKTVPSMRVAKKHDPDAEPETIALPAKRREPETVRSMRAATVRPPARSKPYTWRGNSYTPEWKTQLGMIRERLLSLSL